MLSLGSYLLGAAQLATVALSLGFTAFRLRRRLLPTWDGAPARLVEAIVGVALLIWLSELLGTFGLLYAGTLVGAARFLPLSSCCCSARRRLGWGSDSSPRVAWWRGTPAAPRRAAPSTVGVPHRQDPPAGARCP